MAANAIGASFGLIQGACSKMREFCIHSSTRKIDDSWVEMPPKFSSEPAPSLCWVDMWNEKTCTVLDDYQQVREGPSQSCKAAYLEDPEQFEDVRRSVENQSGWTLREMKRVMHWVFNCTGKLPLQDCDK